MTAISDLLPLNSSHPLDFIRLAGGFDMCMAGIFIFVIYRAVRRGFSGELSRVIGLVAAMTAGLLSFRYFGALTKTIEGIRGNIIPSKFILFTLIVIICFFLWIVVDKFCEYCLKVTVNHKLDIFLGGLLGMIKALSMIMVICIVCYMQPNQDRVSRLEQSSWVFRCFEPLIEIVINR